jgi:hypothetical protein
MQHRITTPSDTTALQVKQLLGMGIVVVDPLMQWVAAVGNRSRESDRIMSIVSILLDL